MKLSVIIPVFNEVRFIEEALASINNSRLPDGVEMEIVIVDDFSSDGTREILKRKYMDKENIKVYFLPENCGKGTALREGFKQATGDIFLIQDADTEYDPKDYSKLLTPILEKKADVVYGSRFLGSIKNMRFPNRVCNRLLTLETNILFGSRITDQATAYKVFRRKVIDSISLKCKKFEFCSEFTAKLLKKGFSIYEVPISYVGRDVKAGKKINWQDGVVALWTLVKYRFIE